MFNKKWLDIRQKTLDKRIDQLEPKEREVMRKFERFLDSPKFNLAFGAVIGIASWEFGWWLTDLYF